MEKRIKFVVCVLSFICAQSVFADWIDDMNGYADDAAIQAVYGTGGVYSSPYGHVAGQDTYKWSSHTALGLNPQNGRYALRTLDRQANTPTISVEAWMCPFTWGNVNEGYTAEIKLAHGTDWDDYHVCVRAATDAGKGRLQVLDGNTWHNLDIDGDGDVDDDDVLQKKYYYKIKIVATPDTVNGGKYDVYIGDVLAYEDASFRSGYETQDSIYVRFTRGGNGGAPAAFDDVTVKSIPEPATIGLLAVGFSGLLRKK